MSASEAPQSAALQKLDGLIAELRAVTISTPAGNAFLGLGGDDCIWMPDTPPGHTSYSWGGEEAPAAAPAKVAATETKAAAPAAAKDKKEKKEKKEAAPKKAPAKKAGAVDPNQPIFSRLDIRAGQIIKAWKHPNADSLYVEEIDVGEEKPRQVVSGLVKFVPLEQMQGARVLVVCNLKPAPMRGVESFGMVLAASNADHTAVELVTPPASAKNGERVTIEGEDFAGFEPEAVVNPKSEKSAWALARPNLKTNDAKEACYEGKALVIGGARCVAPSLANCQVA